MARVGWSSGGAGRSARYLRSFGLGTEMDRESWRAIWEETQATMAHLEESLEQAQELGRSALLLQQASACSEGVAKTLAAMHEIISRARQQVRAAERKLRLADDEMNGKTAA
jgi:hypothetical protein